MAWRIIIRSHGGPEVLEREDFAPAPPAPGEALIRITASGLNFIDTYHRSGLYPQPLPSGLGTEAAGVVEAVGAGVGSVAPGDRVTFILATPGSYATHLNVAADRLIPLPDAISDEIAAASLLKGMTAWMLVEQCAKVQSGQTVLVHAAAGGVGSLLVPWLKTAGATVIAHSGSAAKADSARARGADHSLFGPFETLASEVRRLNNGHGADAVLDGVGAASWEASLASVARRGILVSYGNASGPVPPFAPIALARAGSIYLTRPTLFDYTVEREALLAGAGRLFAQILEGRVEVEIGQRFALGDAAEAHRALEARQTTGSTLLLP